MRPTRRRPSARAPGAARVTPDVTVAANLGFTSASANAFALSNRSAGSFSSAFASAAATFGGTVFRRTVTGCAVSVMIFMITACADDAVNGGSPASISYSTLASEYTSDRAVISFSAVACSGLMYCGVPSESPVSVMRPPAAALTASAMPKSITIARPSCSRMFSGLMSRWIDAVAVRVVERIRHFARDAHRVLDAELRLPVQSLAHRLALDVGHDVVQQPVGTAGVEQREDVRMLQGRRGLDLDDEPLSAEDRGQFRFENLDRDLAVVLEIVREIDRRHAASAELALDGDTRDRLSTEVDPAGPGIAAGSGRPRKAQAGALM